MWKMRKLLKKLTEAKAAEIVPSPAGNLDRKGINSALAAGVAVAPVGAFSDDIVAVMFSGVESAPGIVQQLFGLSFAEQMLGGAVGFFLGAIATAIWKLTRSYE
jgi:hypothetical protein